MKKLKNIYYEKVYDDSLGDDENKWYFDIYDLNKNYITSVLMWDSVLMYNKYGYHYE